MKRLLVVFALALFGCATPYQANGPSGGVWAEQVGPDIYRIQAALNGYSSPAMAQDYILLRAAETARDAGAVGFIILGEQNTSTYGATVMPGQSTTTGSAYAIGDGIYGTATTTYAPTQIDQYVKPGAITMIRLVRMPVPAGLQYLDVNKITGTIGMRVTRAHK